MKPTGSTSKYFNVIATNACPGLSPSRYITYETLAYPIFTAHSCIDLSGNLKHHLQRRWQRDISLVE
jgi:hypothetical protein